MVEPFFCEMPSSKCFVLVVDDDLAVRESLKFALEVEGMKVATCDGGAALLGRSDLGRCDCLVLDQKMPVMDGLTLMAELAARGLALPTILITSSVNEVLRRAARKAGAFAILEKPLLDDVLVENVRRAIVH